LQSTWTVPFERAECARRIKIANVSNFGLTGEKTVYADFRQRGIYLGGRYGRESLSRVFLTSLHVALEDSPTGGTKIVCNEGFIWPVEACFFVFVGAITVAACLLAWVILFEPLPITIKYTREQISIIFVIPAVMLAFAAGMRAIFKFGPGSEEKDIMFDALKRTLREDS
jgi:hypothetical protein